MELIVQVFFTLFAFSVLLLGPVLDMIDVQTDPPAEPKDNTALIKGKNHVS